MIGVSLFFVAAMPEEGFRPVPHGERSHWNAMGGTLQHGLAAVRVSHLLLTLLAVSFFAGAASEGFDRLWEAHLIKDMHLPGIGSLKPVVWFGIISLLGGVVTAAAVSIFRPRLNRITGDHDATARALMALYAVHLGSVVVFALAGNLVLVVVALLAKGVAGTLESPLHENWLIQNIPANVRATVLSMSSQSNAMGQIAGGPGIGLIGTAMSIRAAIVASAVLLSPALPLFGRAIGRGEPALGEADHIPPITEPSGS